MADKVNRYPSFRGIISHEPNRFRSQSSSDIGQLVSSFHLLLFLLVWNQVEWETRWPTKSIVTRCSGADSVTSPIVSEVSLHLKLGSYSPALASCIFYWFGFKESEKQDGRPLQSIPVVQGQIQSWAQSFKKSVFYSHWSATLQLLSRAFSTGLDSKKVRTKMADQVNRYPLFRGRFSHDPNRFRSQSSSQIGQLLSSFYLVHFLLVWIQWQWETRWPTKSIDTRCSGADSVMSPIVSEVSLNLSLVIYSSASTSCFFKWFGINDSEKQDGRPSQSIPFVQGQIQSRAQSFQKSVLI